MKYRKKPVVIEAFQLGNKVDYPHWFSVSFLQGKVIPHKDGTFDIKTLEGIMTASVGDYIIKGVHGEFYPCKPDIFEETYELVE